MSENFKFIKFNKISENFKSVIYFLIYTKTNFSFLKKFVVNRKKNMYIMNGIHLF
jgi:hypothetical protein